MIMTSTRVRCHKQKTFKSSLLDNKYNQSVFDLKATVDQLQPKAEKYGLYGKQRFIFPSRNLKAF